VLYSAKISSATAAGSGGQDPRDSPALLHLPDKTIYSYSNRQLQRLQQRKYHHYTTPPAMSIQAMRAGLTPVSDIVMRE